MRNSVVIVGSGLMGSGIASRAALAGHPVILVDTNEDRVTNGKEKAFVCIDELQKNGLCTTDSANNARKIITTSIDLHEALEHAYLVIEAVFENLDIKRQLFREMDEILPEEIPICSNTSGLRITDISALTKHPERTLTTHFWYPGHLVPLVEVVVGDKSSVELAEKIRIELNSWGKAAVVVKRDLPGQLANRILQSIFREAINIVATGLASAEDVDTAVKMGMGIRFPAWGVFEHIDAVGIDLVHSTQTTVLPDVSSIAGPNPYLSQLLEEGHLGYKSGSGFYDWSKKDMKILEQKRDDFIINALKILNEENVN